MERSSGPPARARSPRTTCASSGSTSSPRARPPSPPDRLLSNENATEPRRLGAGIHEGDLARSSPARLAAARCRAAHAQPPARARHKRGSVRFVLLVLTLVMTAVIVTIVMFRTLYLLLG